MHTLHELYKHHPITHQVLIDLLQDYQHPNNKIHEWLKSGVLISLKRGVYLFNLNQNIKIERFVIANMLYAPSYVSAESALAFRGAIPEQVFTTVSMCMKTPKKFQNKIGNFEYKKIPLSYYPLGIESVQLAENQFALVAVPEKAIMDKIVTTSGVLFRSVVAAQLYLIENLRINEDFLKSLNTKKMKDWMKDTPKKQSLTQLIKAIEQC